MSSYRVDHVIIWINSTVERAISLLTLLISDRQLKLAHNTNENLNGDNDNGSDSDDEVDEDESATLHDEMNTNKSFSDEEI